MSNNISKDITLTYGDGREVKLRLTARRVIGLEERLGGSVPDKLREIDRLSVASEIVAAAVTAPEEYEARRNIALEIYDDMTENGKDMEAYQYLVTDLLVNAGFLRGEEVRAQKELMQRAKEKTSALLAEKIKALQS